MTSLRTALKDCIHKRPQLVLVFAGLLTLLWLALLIWISTGIVELI